MDESAALLSHSTPVVTLYFLFALSSRQLSPRLLPVSIFQFIAWFSFLSFTLQSFSLCLFRFSPLLSILFPLPSHGDYVVFFFWYSELRGSSDRSVSISLPQRKVTENLKLTSILHSLLITFFRPFCLCESTNFKELWELIRGHGDILLKSSWNSCQGAWCVWLQSVTLFYTWVAGCGTALVVKRRSAAVSGGKTRTFE